MRYLFLDTSSQITGWAVVQFINKFEFGILAHGAIDIIHKGKINGYILDTFLQELLRVIDLYHPEKIVIEEQVFMASSQAISTIAIMNGIVMLAASRRQIFPSKIYGYNNAIWMIDLLGNVKKGDDRKKQVLEYLKTLGFKPNTKYFDESDAVGMAIAYFKGNRQEEEEMTDKERKAKHKKESVERAKIKAKENRRNK